MGAEGRLPAWARIAAELAVACLLWAALLAAFSRLVVAPAPARTPPVAYEVALPPPPPAAAPPRPAAARPPLKLRPAPRGPHRPRPAVPHEAAATAAVAASEAPPVAMAEAVPAAPEGRDAPSEPEPASALAGGDTGARAVYQPLPEIPPEIREHALSAVVTARFAIATDGSARVTLLAATPSPRLNALLLRTLAAWRFFPALREGVPVASELELRIPVTIE